MDSTQVSRILIPILIKNVGPVLVGLVVLRVLLMWLQSKLKGSMGEVSVATILKGLDKKEYRVISDLILPGQGRTRTSQIDHVVVSTHGLFCIETKNYKGTILGSDEDKQWVQVLYGRSYAFMNPLRQNYGHIQALKEVLAQAGFEDLPIYGIVTFPGDTHLKLRLTEENVVRWGALKRTIKSYAQGDYLTLGIGLNRPFNGTSVDNL